MSEIKDSLTALASDVESALTRRRSRSATAISWFREAALLPVLAVLIVVGAVLNSHFLTVSNITGIGQQVSALGVVVVGESLILASPRSACPARSATSARRTSGRSRSRSSWRC